MELPKRRARVAWTVLKRTFVNWYDNNPFQNSAVISYYTIFSLPGLLVITVNLAGYFFGTEPVIQQISEQTGGMIGREAATNIEQIITRATESNGMRLASILGIAVLLFGATGVFYHLQQIFDRIWEVEPKKKVRQLLLQMLKERLLSFVLVVAVGLLMLVTLLLSAALSALSDWFAQHVSKSQMMAFTVGDFLLSLTVVTFLFGALFKIIPSAQVRWRDVWLGALFTALLFVVAKTLLGLYFGKSDHGSTYGAASSMVLVMGWVWYVGLILLLGAEFTHVCTSRKRGKVPPREIAEEAGAESRGDSP